MSAPVELAARHILYGEVASIHHKFLPSYFTESFCGFCVMCVTVLLNFYKAAFLHTELKEGVAWFVKVACQYQKEVSSRGFRISSYEQVLRHAEQSLRRCKGL